MLTFQVARKNFSEILPPMDPGAHCGHRDSSFAKGIKDGEEDLTHWIPFVLHILLMMSTQHERHECCLWVAGTHAAWFSHGEFANNHGLLLKRCTAALGSGVGGLEDVFVDVGSPVVYRRRLPGRHVKTLVAVEHGMSFFVSCPDRIRFVGPEVVLRGCHDVLCGCE